MNRLSKSLLLSSMVASQLMALAMHNCDTGVVTSNLDDGNNTLRACIRNAETGDTITFASDMTIVLTEALSVWDKNIAIDGEDHEIVIDGNKDSGGFLIETSDLNISNLTIQNGSSRSGGAIEILNNTGKTINIKNSTLKNNNALHYGGAISTSSGGSAIKGYVTLNIENSTISGNRTSGNCGALELYYAHATLNHVTVTKNNNTSSSYHTRGICGTFTSSNSIIAGNGDGSEDFTIIISNGYNLLGNKATESLSKTQPSNTKITRGVAQPVFQPTDEVNVTDPMLHPLGDNGGVTPTHMPMVDSPAIGTGTIGGLPIDQVGNTRASAATKGAVEFVETTEPETNTTTPPPPEPTTAHYDVGSTSVTAEGIPGATATVDEAGNNVVTASLAVNGITYTAVVTTVPSGTTTVTISFVNPTTGQPVEYTQTFPAGVTIEASIVNGQLVVSITVKSDEPFVIE
jgi:hypothetical protein